MATMWAVVDGAGVAAGMGILLGGIVGVAWLAVEVAHRVRRLAQRRAGV
jgi:hypothetical protein